MGENSSANEKYGVMFLLSLLQQKKSLLATTITDCNGEHGKMSQSSHPRFARRRPDQDTERCAGAAGEDRMKNLKCSSRQLRDEKMPSCLLALV